MTDLNLTRQQMVDRILALEARVKQISEDLAFLLLAEANRAEAQPRRKGRAA